MKQPLAIYRRHSCLTEMCGEESSWILGQLPLTIPGHSMSSLNIFVFLFLQKCIPLFRLPSLLFFIIAFYKVIIILNIAAAIVDVQAFKFPQFPRYLNGVFLHLKWLFSISNAENSFQDRGNCRNNTEN